MGDLSTAANQVVAKGFVGGRKWDGLFLLVRLGLGVMFLVSSFYKIREPDAFLANVYAYELVNSRLSVVIAVLLPWLEMGVGVFLLAGAFTGGALGLSVLLLAVFAIAQGSALWRGLIIDCGCFSATSTETVSSWTFLRTSLLFVAAAGTYVWELLRFSPKTV